jgi:hypothetical protein
MKKIILASILIMQSIVILSQKEMGGDAMGKGKNVLYLGIGAGHGVFGASQYKGYGYVYRSSPTIHIGFEHGLTEAVPQSIIGIGGSISLWFGSQKYSDNYGHEWHKKWTDVTTLVKGYYHHKFLVSDKWDVYAAVMAGIKHRSYTYTTNDQYYYYQNSDETGVEAAGGIALGGRIYITKSFGFYAEAGAGLNIDYIQGGIVFKF